MGLVENSIIVFVAGFITALATGIGALPFFFIRKISDRWQVAMWGFASGIMVAASVLGLVPEGLAEGTWMDVGLGALIGVVLVYVSHEAIHAYEFEPEEYEEADFRKLVIIIGILTVHSFPEGLAVGVAFADLGLDGGIPLLGFTVPMLAIVMTVAISIHNVPEGIAISIPLKSMDVSEWKMVWWSVFSSLPQPIGAVIAFAFVQVVRQFLPVAFGLAAGAMTFLVLLELVPEALEQGETLPRNGYVELVGGVAAGALLMVPFEFL